MNPCPLGRRTRRPVVYVWVAAVVLMTLLGGAPELAWALDCEGRLVSEGQAPWEVQAICGEPTQVDASVEIVLKPAYDVFGRVVDHFPVAVPKSVWTYNFGPSRLVYHLTFRPSVGHLGGHVTIHQPPDGAIRQHFHPRRHLVSALTYRQKMQQRFHTWRKITNLPTAA